MSVPPASSPATPPQRTRLALVEDHTLLAESVGLALAAEGLDVVVADLTSPDALHASLAADPTLLVLLDLDLGGAIGDGTDLIPGLVAAGAAVLVVSGVRDRIRIAAALEAGAIGFLPKDEPFEVLLDTALRAAASERVLDQNERHTLLAELRAHRAQSRQQFAPFERLTPREQEVLRELTAGKSVESIAADSFVSTATVRTQVRGVLTKLDVRSQLAAVAKARAAGWTP